MTMWEFAFLIFVMVAMFVFGCELSATLERMKEDE